MEAERPFGSLGGTDPHAESEAIYVQRNRITNQGWSGPLRTCVYRKITVPGIKVFMLTVSVVTVLSDFKDGLVVGLIACGLTTTWNWWIWNKAIGAFNWTQVWSLPQMFRELCIETKEVSGRGAEI